MQLNNRFMPPSALRRLQINAGIYLIYLAVVARVVLLFNGDKNLIVAIELLGGYGALLVASHWLPGRSKIIRAAYLLAQVVLVLAFIPLSFEQNFFPILLIPLGLQAVLFFGKREGYFWIGGLAITAVALVFVTEQGQAAAFAEAGLYAGALIFIGRYASLNQEADSTRQQNQQLLEDLRATYHQLMESASQVGEYAVLQERSRMARDLHDSVTQTIFSMNLAVQAAQLLAKKDPQRVEEQLDRLQALAGSAVSEFQVLSNRMKPSTAPVEEGLPAALRRLAGERETRDGLKVSLTITGQRALPQPVAAGLYRIAQEALTNTAKHAGVRDVAIHLRQDSLPACLEIEDQGNGFDIQQVGWQAGHLGMQGMLERAQEIHWKLSVDSRPGRGTSIRVEEICE
jgi:signal transduction histidine kinase